MIPFQPTHRIVVEPSVGRRQEIEVMRPAEYSGGRGGPLYTEEEYMMGAPAAWDMDDEGRLTCQGMTIPSNVAVITVEPLSNS